MQLTVDKTTPNQSPVLKPVLKPRPLPLDLTKRFSPDPAVSLNDTPDHHDAGKAPQKRDEDPTRTPSNEKAFEDLDDEMKTPKSEGPNTMLFPKETEALTVRASVFENVIEKHNVLMVDEKKHEKTTLENTDEEGLLVTATYKEPVSPSGPVRVLHAVDTVPAAEESTVSSEIIPSAQREDKAMTLRSRRSVREKSPPEKRSSEQTSNAPRYLRVGALPKWTLENDMDVETAMPKEKESDFVVDDPSTTTAKRLKTQQTEEQVKPRATYFALTGQMQEAVTATSNAVDNVPFSDPSAQLTSQGKVLPFKRNTSLDEAFGIMPESTADTSNLNTETQREKQKQLELNRQAELERRKEREMQCEYERQRQIAFEKEKQESEENQRALDIQKQIELERQKHLEFERQRQLKLKQQRQLEVEKRRQSELDRQKQNELERQKQVEVERQKQAEIERLRQIELDKQRQIEMEDQIKLEFKKQEIERQKQLELENQRKQEVERQRQIEFERQCQIERQKELAMEKQRLIEAEQQKLRAIERQKQNEMELERQRQIEKEKQEKRELEKQMELEKQKHIERKLELERQKEIELEKQRLDELERHKMLEIERENQLEKERQRQLDKERHEMEMQRQREEERRQKELDRERQLMEKQEKQRKLAEAEEQERRRRERQQVVELEKQRLREKLEKEQAEKLRLMALEQEALRLREVEKERQLERERQLEMERDMQREQELQWHKELEAQRQKQLDMERQELEKQRLREQRKLAEAEEQERRRRERQQVLELEKQRLREKLEKEQAEKLRLMALEQEALRLREVEKERQLERERQLEMERDMQREQELQRHTELERQRQKQLAMERQEMEKQRIRQQEQERERQMREDLDRMKELERRQLQEFDKQKLAERQQIHELEKRRVKEKMEREGAERMRQVSKQQEAERQRLKEKQKKEEQERIRLESAALRPKVVDLDSVLRNEQSRGSSRGDPSTRWKEPSPKSEKPLRPGILGIDTLGTQSQPSPNRDLFPVVGIQEEHPRIPMSPQNTGGLQSPNWMTSPQNPWEVRSIEMSVDKPEEPKKSFSKTSLEQLLQRQEVRRQSSRRRWSGLVVDDPFQMGQFSGPEIKPAAPTPTVSISAASEQVWLSRDEPQAQIRAEGPSQRRTQGSTELNRIRSRSMSRHSTPSSSAVENSLSRIRSRSAHRDEAQDSLYLGDKITVAQSQMTGWVGNVRRSFHGALGFLRSGQGEDGTGDFKRTNSLRSLASRSRDSIRRFSLRSQQRLSLRRRTAPNTPIAVQQKQNTSTEDESKDSETPVHETDSQYGTWETGLHSEDSLTPATPSSNLSPSPTKPHVETDAADQLASSDLLPFPDVPVTLLNTSAQRSRAQLGKKRAPPTRPSRAARLTQPDAAVSEDLIFQDSTEEKPEIKEEDSDSEEQPKGSDAGPTAASSQPQRVALFPGMDQSALMAQLKKRGDSDNQTDGSAPVPSQLSRSPKSPFLPRASRVLPPPGGKENNEEDSPQWLKELKSKKRLSQYESES
uniref:Tankyrase 1-binding protein C-terminal domain-containing protein n=1 Tax=Knipowitschia caucasica TaxID=637954 RepID=A0AAV2MT90_KNICA